MKAKSPEINCVVAFYLYGAASAFSHFRRERYSWRFVSTDDAQFAVAVLLVHGGIRNLPAKWRIEGVRRRPALVLRRIGVLLERQTRIATV